MTMTTTETAEAVAAVARGDDADVVRQRTVVMAIVMARVRRRRRRHKSHGKLRYLVSNLGHLLWRQITVLHKALQLAQRSQLGPDLGAGINLAPRLERHHQVLDVTIQRV